MSCCSPLLLVALATASDAQKTPPPPPTEGRWALGGAISARPNGVVDLGIRRGDLSAELLTDTLDLRWAPARDRGRHHVAVRLQGGAAGLWINRWTAGAPDPGRSALAFRASVEGGWQRWLPEGAWIGGRARISAWTFAPLPTTTVDLPEAGPVAHLAGEIGLHREALQGQIVAGADAWPGTVAPSVTGTVRLRPSWTVAPLVELRAGVAQHQDARVRTRLGGLNPYVIPLAGAAWAEFWVEDYAAARIGIEGGRDVVTLRALADLAWFDGQRAVGFALGGTVSHDAWRVELEVGAAPWLARPDGQLPASAWLRVGQAWHTIGGGSHNARNAR